MEERLALSGSIRSPRDGQVFSQVDGYVTGVDVLPGERVAEGQVVLRLDDEIPRLELRRLRALLAEAESLHEDMRRRTREAKDLIEDDNFSRSEYESLRAETLAAEARVATIRAEAAIQETRLRQHAVVAPFDGVVARKLVERGQRISGSTPLLRVFSMDPLWADVRVPEQYLPRISTGDAMEIRPATGAPIGTAVKWIVPAGADQSRTFLVRGEFPNPDWRIGGKGSHSSSTGGVTRRASPHFSPVRSEIWIRYYHASTNRDFGPVTSCHRRRLTRTGGPKARRLHKGRAL